MNFSGLYSGVGNCILWVISLQGCVSFQIWQALNYCVLHSTCQKNFALCSAVKLPARDEMAEPSEPARENWELQKAPLVLYSLLIECRENGSILTRGKVFVVKDLLPLLLILFKISSFSDLVWNLKQKNSNLHWTSAVCRWCLKLVFKNFIEWVYFQTNFKTFSLNIKASTSNFIVNGYAKYSFQCFEKKMSFNRRKN